MCGCVCACVCSCVFVCVLRWQWLYWVSPMSWAIRSIALNEFNAPSYDFLVGGVRAGTTYLEAYEVQTAFVWKWVGLAYLFGFYLVTVGTISAFDRVCACVPPVEFIVRDHRVVPHRAVLCILAMTYLKREDIRSVPYSEDPQKYIAPTHRKRYVWDGDNTSTGLPASTHAGSCGPVHTRHSSTHTHSSFVFKLFSVTDTLAEVISSMKPVEPVTVVFKHLTYAVPVAGGSKTLLSDVSGYALPGTLTALMGASGPWPLVSVGVFETAMNACFVSPTGAGKTTLLDVISGRKTGGTMAGDILANGVPKDTKIFPKITGYVEQNDIHDPHCTVREGLTFSAKLVRLLAYAV